MGLHGDIDGIDDGKHEGRLNGNGLWRWGKRNGLTVGIDGKIGEWVYDKYGDMEGRK